MRKKFTFILVLITTLCGCNSSAQETVEWYKVEPAKEEEPIEPIMSLNVVRPKFGKKLDFAGEKVPLEKQFVAEALTNELIITQNMHSATLRTLLNSKRYFSIIEPILKKNGIPEDFKYLCVAESSLNPNAYSPAKAAGMWQIMSATAKYYGLEITDCVDERYHIEKSCEVACKYLKDSYRQFKSWTLAAASYNVGRAGLSRRMETQEEESFYTSFLPTETMRYVYRILTYKILFENPSELGYNLTKEDYYPTLKYSTIEIDSTTIDWVELAKSHSTSYKELRDYNPWIREYIHPNKSNKNYEVKIPKN